VSTRSNTEPDTKVRAPETRLFEHYDLRHAERLVEVHQPAVTVRVIEVDGDRDQPPIVLLHGIASATVVAVPLMSQLRGRRIIAIDWPGHGLSGPCVLHRNDSIRNHAVSVIAAVVDSFGVTTVDLVGHSMGGQFGLYYALAEPDRVRRLVLLGAPGAGFVEVRPSPIMRALAVPGLGRMLLRMPMSQKQYSRNNDAMLGKGVLDSHPSEIAEAGYHAARRHGFAPSVSSFFRSFITPFRVRADTAVSHEALASLAIPTLLVWGDKDIFLTPVDGQPSIDSIRDATVLVVSGGHAPWLDELDRCGTTIASFLAAKANHL